MTAPLPVSTAHARLLGAAFDTMSTGLVLVGAPPAVGKTCLSLNLAAHFAAHLGESVLYFSPASPREVILARLAKNLTPDGETTDVARVADLPLVVLDSPTPSSAELLEAATTYVAQHGQPGLVLVNDLQSLRPGKEGLTGLASAIDIMADMRGISKVCDAPLVLFSQLAEGKGVSAAIREQADRVVTVQMSTEDPTFKVLAVSYADPPEPEDGVAYELALARSTGVLALR
ncbi:MAG: replicative helicase [Cyanobacteria bacterium RYN_339]|nr:replicative helicase [Cyanobacteria bacterium RYN_339]